MTDWMGATCPYCDKPPPLAIGNPAPCCRAAADVAELAAWKASMLAVHAAADEKLRPLVQGVPGALGRNVYEVAAEEIVRLRAALLGLVGEPRPESTAHLFSDNVLVAPGERTAGQLRAAWRALGFKVPDHRPG